MSLLSNILNFFGTKSKRDMKELTPVVDKVLHYSAELSSLSNDELRKKTSHFKLEIHKIIKHFDDKINDLKKTAGQETDRELQEKFYKEIDDLSSSVSANIASQPNFLKDLAIRLIVPP